MDLLYQPLQIGAWDANDPAALHQGIRLNYLSIHDGALINNSDKLRAFNKLYSASGLKTLTERDLLSAPAILQLIKNIPSVQKALEEYITEVLKRKLHSENP